MLYSSWSLITQYNLRLMEGSLADVQHGRQRVVIVARQVVVWLSMLNGAVV